MPPEPAGAPAAHLPHGLCVARVLFVVVICLIIGCFAALFFSCGGLFCFYRAQTDRAMYDETNILQFISFDSRAAHRMMPFFHLFVQGRLDFILCSIVLFTFRVRSTWSQYFVATPVIWWSQSTAPIVSIRLTSMAPIRHAFPGRWVPMSLS